MSRWWQRKWIAAGVAFFLGALGFSFFPSGCASIPETTIEVVSSDSSWPASEPAIRPTDFRLAVWKLKDSVRPGDVVNLSVRHERAGPEGRLRFVVFESLTENYEMPKFVEASPNFEASQPGQWSQWEFRARHQVVYVGVAWDSPEAPVLFAEANWRNPVVLSNHAYVGRGEKLEAKRIPLAANLRAKPPRSATHPQALFFVVAWLLSLAVVAAFFAKPALNLTNFVAFALGAAFAYRAWALTVAPYWSWGANFVHYVPAWLGAILVGAVPVLGLGLLLAPLPTKRIRFLETIAGQVFVVVSFVALAWIFNSNRIYGDWAHGFINHTHAPLTSAWYSGLALIAGKIPWLKDNFNSLISIACFAPFLWILIRFSIEDEKPELRPFAFLFLISGATLQIFFGEIEIYAVPSLWWLLFTYTSLRALEGRAPIWLPTFVSFVCYLTHVAEALLIFSVIHLWIHEWMQRRPTAKKFGVTGVGLAVASVALMAAVSFGLFHFRFKGVEADFARETTHRGWEFLWGSHRQEGVFLPVFSMKPPLGLYNPPGPDYPAFSVDNVAKFLGYWFLYSPFFFLVPIFVLVKERLAPLRDPKISFLFLSFAIWTLYCFFASVGWVPVIRDWHYFSLYSHMGALLTYLLVRKQHEALGLLQSMTAVNLLQTATWIGVNHFGLTLPW